LALDGWPGHFTPGERTPGNLWTGGWRGPRSGLDAVLKRKILSPYWESDPGYPACSLVAMLTELSPLLKKLTAD